VKVDATAEAAEAGAQQLRQKRRKSAVACDRATTWSTIRWTAGTDWG
jgi:hypothetical protein